MNTARLSAHLKSQQVWELIDRGFPGNRYSVHARARSKTHQTAKLVSIFAGKMDSEQHAAFVEDPDEAWAIDVDTVPLVNISTFGWTEGDMLFTAMQQVYSL